MITRIVIAGGGTAGWMTAAALANRIVGATSIQVTLVESEEIGTVGVGEGTTAALPPFHDAAYGFDEAEMMRASGATFKLGIRFNDWSYIGHSYFHSFGKFGVEQDTALIDFHHYWLHSRQVGETPDLSDFNLSAVAAASGRFAKKVEAPAGLPSELPYAYHFDARLYAGFLRKFAEARGIRRLEGKISRVLLDSEDGLIEALLLEDGRRLDADFFFDCTGFRGLLIEDTLSTGFEDWSHLLPCDRAVAVPAKSILPRVPFTTSTAHAHGWQWHIPLQHRSGNGYVYSSSFCSDDEAAQLLLNNIAGEPLGEPMKLRFTPGCRRKSWNGNCVAIGLSAGFLEPLEATSIALIHTAIHHFLFYFPEKRHDPTRAGLFNRAIDSLYRDIRNLLILHYMLNRRTDSPMWQACREIDVPDELGERIEVFRKSAHIRITDDQFFNLASNLTIMLSQGINPESYHQVLASLNQNLNQNIPAYMRRLKAGIRDTALNLPTLDEFIESYCPMESASRSP